MECPNCQFENSDGSKFCVSCGSPIEINITCPIMQTGTSVRLKADPGRVGVITGRTRQRAGKTLWQIRFPDGADYQKEIHLEILSENGDDPIELLRLGKLGRARDLRGSLTHIRLNGRLADLIYSMDTTKTDFYPYQFKPVLNFLDAPGNGILIADEVGLGKTIEAGLIWTELRSRFDIRRVMVLCPAMLQEKWQSELLHRFGIDAEINSSRDVLKRFQDYKSGVKTDIAMICSMQGLRPRKRWRDENERQVNASKLSKFLEENENEEHLLDLLIVDEAHYLRNPESMTSVLGRLLRSVSEHIVLLSATPIHLRNRDLYQLLNLVDENTFNQPQIFDEILEANEPIHVVRDALLTKELTQDEFVSLLERTQQHPFFQDNHQINALLENPPSDEELKDKNNRTFLANRFESINLLGRTVTRTRKRDVTEWRVDRDVFREMVSLSKPEQEFYTKVTALIREYASKNESHEGFLMVMPQRQMSSSMPAALLEWQNKSIRASEQMYEDFGLDEINDEIGPLTQALVNEAFEMGDYEELKTNDSKYKRLRKIVTTYLNKYPNEKIVLFAYFRPTLKYLKERLTADGISCSILMGGQKTNKYETLRDFQKKDGPQILLSSEVASEGVDLQFSKVLINYDLPWNPMKIEQRIGRIDRLGQKASKILIWNLFYEDTIDERIYTRLYERIDIFQRALGNLEAVLGDEIKRLTQELLFAKLTPAQEQARIEQTEQAISYLRAQEEKLEAEAGNLVAHGDYILNQVSAAKELQRVINSNDIWNYIHDYFSKEYVGSEFFQINTEELIFDVRLSDKAKFDFGQFLKNKNLQGQSNLANPYPPKVKCLFQNKVSGSGPGRGEIINQTHPLVRFVSDMINSSSFSYYSPISVELQRHEISGVNPGMYVFYVECWSFKGIKEIEKLTVTACKYSTELEFLPDNDAEKLVTLAARTGKDWMGAAAEINFSLAVELTEQCMERSEIRYEAYNAQLKHENNDRADIQEKTLIQHRNSQLEKLESLLARYLAEGREKIAKPTQGRIDALKSRVEQKLQEINSRKDLNSSQKEISFGLIWVS